MKLDTSRANNRLILFLILGTLCKGADANNPIYNVVCEIGYYGENCDNRCSRYCFLPRQCDRVTGQCYGGCQPGWYTITCEQKCPFGTFGNNCREECGYCQEKGHCHHINGSCLKGCLQGYSGEQCKNQCANGYYGKNCENKCSKYCSVPTRCDRVTGQCYGGCHPGWYTTTCELKTASSGIASISAGVFVQVAVFAVVICVF